MTDMTKAGVKTTQTERPTPPRTINLATMAVGAQIVFALLYAVLEWPLTAQLRRAVISSNAKNQKTPLCDAHPGKGCLDVARSVRSFQIETSIGTALVSLVIVLLVVRVRRAVRSARILYVAISVFGAIFGFASSPLSILAITSAGPVLPRVLSTLGAVSAMVAIFLLFVPESSKFFPAAVRKSGAKRGLFAPRPAAERKAPPTSGLRSSAASRAVGQATPKGAAGVRAKTRAEEAAVARGAELARSRAKASKSRRTEL